MVLTTFRVCLVREDHQAGTVSQAYLVQFLSVTLASGPPSSHPRSPAFSSSRFASSTSFQAVLSPSGTPVSVSKVRVDRREGGGRVDVDRGDVPISSWVRSSSSSLSCGFIIANQETTMEVPCGTQRRGEMDDRHVAKAKRRFSPTSPG